MASEKCLVVLEVSQKQNYIFATNRLKENIGASIIIREITKEALEKAVESYFNAETRKQYPSDSILPEQHKNEIPAYMKQIAFNNGGGKSTFLFDSVKEAEAFIKITSLYILRNYPETEPYFAKLSYMEDEKMADMPELIERLYKELNRQKGRRQESFRFIGLGLSKKCPSTSLPVNLMEQSLGYSNELVQIAKKELGKTGERYHLSTYAKLVAERNQDEVFRKMIFGETDKTDIKFPNRFDQLGCSEGEKNRIAIICIDGNKMGSKVERITENFRNKETSKYKNRTYGEVIRRFSEYIENVYTEAQREVVCAIFHAREHLSKVLDYHNIPENMAAIRPLILAGDDVCFVTDARIGLDAAALMLKTINRKSKEKYAMIQEYGKYFEAVVNEDGLYASAGVVLCGQKYPFSRAHELAESLLHNAKAKVPEGKDGLMLDFQVIMGEAESSITKERKKQETGRSLRGGTRPYCISGQVNEVTSFSELQKAIANLNNLIAGNDETGRKAGRSKIKELAYYIQQGDDMVKRYIHCSRDLKELQEMNGSYGIYLDAIEMLDFYQKIEDGGKE